MLNELDTSLAELDGLKSGDCGCSHPPSSEFEFTDQNASLPLPDELELFLESGLNDTMPSGAALLAELDSTFGEDSCDPFREQANRQATLIRLAEQNPGLKITISY